MRTREYYNAKYYSKHFKDAAQYLNKFLAYKDRDLKDAAHVAQGSLKRFIKLYDEMWLAAFEEEIESERKIKVFDGQELTVPFPKFGKTKAVPLKVYRNGHRIPEVAWDKVLWVERDEDWYGLDSQSYKDKNVLVVEREDWRAARELANDPV